MPGFHRVVLFSLPLVLFTSVTPAQDTVHVITDTVAYCNQLAHQLADALRATSQKPPERIQTLADAGKRLCQRGEIHGGIIRLRRALMLAHQGETQE
jgi:hypothetical protein